MIREKILSERYRGGKRLYVVKRIEEIKDIEELMKENVKEMKVEVENGKMEKGVMDEIMNELYEGKYDVII